MKILVLGGKGMLGHKMFQILGERFDEVACTIRGRQEDEFYRGIDLFKGADLVESFNAIEPAPVRQMLEERKPDFVVNCVGIIKQRDEAELHIPSITLNSLLPHVLADACEGWGGRVIHFSTDCVFSGKKGNYIEDDPSDAEDLYGKSKYLGEVATENALTLRTSIIGRELSQFQSLLEWFLSQDGETVRGFTRAMYSGVTTNHLADVVTMVIRDYPHLSGLYQVVSDTVSKYDLLVLLREAYDLDIEIVPDDTVVCDRSMLGNKFREATGYACPSWSELVSQLATDSTPYEQWRETT